MVADADHSKEKAGDCVFTANTTLYWYPGLQLLPYAIILLLMMITLVFSVLIF